MTKPFVISINSVEYQTAYIQARLLATRLKSNDYNVQVVEFNGLIDPIDNLSEFGKKRINKYLNELNKQKNKKVNLFIFVNYLAFDLLAVSNVLNSYENINTYYVWLKSQHFLNKLPSADIEIVLTNPSYKSFNTYLDHESNKTVQGIHFNSELSVANLNTKIIESVNKYLSKQTELTQKQIAISTEALNILKKNHELALLAGSESAEILRPVEFSTSFLDKPEVIKSKKYENIELIDYWPRNELDLIPQSEHLKYQTKYKRLAKFKSNPRLIKSKYTFRITLSFDKFLKLQKKIPITKKINTAVIYYELINEFNDPYSARYNQVLVNLSKTLEPKLFMPLLNNNCLIEIIYEANYRDTVKILIYFKSSEYEPSNKLCEELSNAHPILFENYT